MRLNHILIMAMATFVTAAGSLSEARATENANFRKVAETNQIHSINTAQTETTSKRILRGAEPSTADNVYYYPPKKEDSRRPFIEVRLKKALTNPKKTQRLYERWYKSGFSAKQVAKGLDQSENRELDVTYKNLAKGYAVFINKKRS